MKSLKTIILAAGKSTRFKSETPKVLHELWGRPVIDYVLDVAKAAGSLKTFVVVGHRAEAVTSAVSGRAETVLQAEQKGTAHAVRCCAGHFKGFNGDVLVLCGDTPLLDAKIVRQLVARHRRTKAACTFLTANLSSPFGYGRIIRDGKGDVAAIREEKDATEDEKKISEINVGVYCFRSSELFKSISRIRENDRKKEFYLTDIIEIYLRGGLRVESIMTDDWTATLGINTRTDLALAANVSRQKILKSLMDSGVTIVDPASTFIESGVVIGQDTVIHPCTYIHSGVKVGKNCSVGPFARLRPGTTLADQVTVGNFTEVSRSTLAEGVLMKHFSFLGDTTVGRKTNIGCGTVTANYDGKNKNKTRIGQGAFIGCDAILVAPVEIGDGAIAGAGSVVTPHRSIPAGAVAVGVPARVIRRRERS